MMPHIIPNIKYAFPFCALYRYHTSPHYVLYCPMIYNWYTAPLLIKPHIIASNKATRFTGCSSHRHAILTFYEIIPFPAHTMPCPLVARFDPCLLVVRASAVVGLIFMGWTPTSDPSPNCSLLWWSTFIWSLLVKVLRSYFLLGPFLGCHVQASRNPEGLWFCACQFSSYSWRTFFG